MKRLLLMLGLVASSFVTAQAAPRPNIVVILTDDLGWGSVGCYGADPRLVKTPNIDRLAREGRRYTDANTTSSVCSPTRYALMTGRYCWRTSLESEVLGTTAPLHIETDRLTIASMLKPLGYRSAAVGKWHLGYGSAERCDFTTELKPGPLEIGFDYHFGVPSNHGDISGVYVENHWVYGLDRANPQSPSPPYQTMGQQKGKPTRALELNAPKRVDDEVMQTLTDKVVDWIDQQSTSQPFFVYFTPVAVHNPITPSKVTAGSSPGGAFCDFLHDLDLSVGRVLDVLDKKGLTDNTLVLFTSDNGGVNKDNGDTPQNAARSAGLLPVGPFRGGKHDVWEGGFRVPYLVRWPGHVPAGTVCDETISLVDTLASLAALVQAPLPAPATAAEDSFNVSASWLGQPHPSPLRPHLIVHSADGNFAIRQAHWKWIEGVPAANVKPAAKKARNNQMRRMLFHLQSDITESNDLATAEPARAAELESWLVRYRDGGYSRELPPVVDKPKAEVVSLAPLTGKLRLQLPLAEVPGRPWVQSKGTWNSREGAIWTTGKNEGSSLTGPLQITDGVLQFEIKLGDAGRHSLRVQTSDSGSFRVVLFPGSIEVARNPAPGQPASNAVALAKRKLTYDRQAWQTMRLTFTGTSLVVEVAGAKVTATDAIFGKPKDKAAWIAFDGEVGIRNLIVQE